MGLLTRKVWYEEMKYEFTGETKTVNTLLRTITYRRIRAKVAFGIVKAGEVGGWIEKEENLSDDGDAWVFGNAEVSGDAWVSGNARVLKTTHIFVIGPAGSRNAYTTFYRDKDNEISVRCGCFCEKLDKFLKKVSETHGTSKYALVYQASVELAKMQIELKE